MAEFVDPIIGLVPCLWTCCCSHVAYITDRKEMLNTLLMKKETLMAIKLDLNEKVRSAEQKGMTRTNQVEDWLKRVEDTENSVNEIIQQHEKFTANPPCLRKCRCRSAYRLGKRATKMIPVITELITTCEFQVAIQLSAPREGFCMMPMEEPVGIEADFQRVWEALEDNNVGKIGLYGMGGVGKTTLLQRINNELSRKGDIVFDVAIWVVASKQATKEAIQRVIFQKLQIPSVEWSETMKENSAVIHQKLKGKKYILMLDDVWERLDLLRVGIPSPNTKNKSKIIFTTRSEDVCFRMKADRIIKVMCLPKEKALSLFLENVGEAALTSHYEIRRLAELVAEECKGLPLALITIGQAMSGRKTLSEWSYALKQLKEYPPEFLGVKRNVLSVLRFSYDSLADSTTQKCFLYCSLFPEDNAIPNEQLVDLWMGEGYLKEHDVKEARNHGFSIIKDLKRACLLENEIDFLGKSSVKMHDVIHDMALWIASDYGKYNKRFITFEGAKLMSVESNIQDWNEDVEKMMLWRWCSEVSEYSYRRRGICIPMFKHSTCIFPRLATLVVDLSMYDGFPGFGSFKCLPCLKVLDLSARVQVHPSTSLKLDGISELRNLEYLDLSGLQIDRLPEECKHLSKLKYLLMDYTHYMREFPTEIIFGLTELLMFSMDSIPLYHESFMRGLESLQKLQEISIYMNSIDLLEFFLKSEKLQKCARSIKLEYIFVNVLKLCPTNIKNLESLHISSSGFKTIDCNPTLMVFNNLGRVDIKNCNFLDLDFLVYAPSLKKLSVGWCRFLRRISCIAENHMMLGEVIPMFSSLKQLWLYGLPSLEIICNKPLPFSSLEIIELQECPKLHQNPFSDMIPTNTKLTKIKVEKEWWDSLNWIDDRYIHRDFFSQYFQNTHKRLSNHV